MKECRPDDYYISEVQVSVSLQQLLNITAHRLCNVVALDWSTRDLQNLELMGTLGFDSSSGHTNPHQRYENIEYESTNAQHSLFVSSIIIISRRTRVSNNTWINPTPQSVRFCRPLRIALEKETDEITKREFNRLNRELKTLKSYEFSMSNSKSAKVKFNVFQTLFDGKCLNTIVGNTASTRCPMCLRTTHEFGDFDDDFAPKKTSLIYGLGLLHVEIKSFEHLLHISSRKDIKIWNVKKSFKGKLQFSSIYIFTCKIRAHFTIFYSTTY